MSNKLLHNYPVKLDKNSVCDYLYDIPLLVIKAIGITRIKGHYYKAAFKQRKTCLKRLVFHVLLSVIKHHEHICTILTKLCCRHFHRKLRSDDVKLVCHSSHSTFHLGTAFVHICRIFIYRSEEKHQIIIKIHFYPH